MTDDKQLLGEIHAMTKQNGDDINALVDLVRDVRENGTVVCKQNTIRIDKLTKAVLIIGAVVFGADKIMDFML